jgi:hypothetical protein
MKSFKLLSLTLVAVLGIALAQFDATPAHATADSIVRNTNGMFFKQASDGKYYPGMLCESTDGSQGFVPCREGGSGVTPVYLDSSSTNIVNNSYVQATASTAGAAKAVTVYNGSTAALALAIGGSGSEADKLLIAPSGWTPLQKLFVPSGSRISLKSKGSDVSSGLVLINLVQ